MRTFTNELNAGRFWLAVILPPAVFWIAMASLSGPDNEREVSLPAFLFLLGLAHGLPLAALIWTLVSVCACSVSPKGLIIHRVTSDQAWPLSSVRYRARMSQKTILIDLGQRQLLLRPEKPDEFMAALGSATEQMQGEAIPRAS